MTKKPQDKTIKLTIYLYADGLEAKRQAWNQGVVNIRTNRLHGLRATDSTQAQFDDINDLTDKVKQVLKSAGITLVQKEKGSDKKYIVEY